MDRIYRIAHEGAARHALERDGVWRLVEGDLFDGFTLGSVVPGKGHQLLPPVDPSKIVAVGLNYRDHAAERNKPVPTEPVIFIKPSTAVIGSGATIRIPPGVGRVDHEAELGVVIGKRAHQVPANRARECILGLTCVNDVTARDLQHRDTQVTRSKGFDTFAPIGPCIALGLDSGHLNIEGWVNQERRQASNTRELVFSVEHLVSFISSIMTLLPGDIIATGTPAGIGPIHPGDRVTIKIEQIGELTNTVEECS